MAVVAIRGVSIERLQPVNVGEEYGAVHNGEYVFLWRNGRHGAQARALRADEAPELLERARTGGTAPTAEGAILKRCPPR